MTSYTKDDISNYELRLITLNKWTIKEGLYLCSYTAEWCKPCKKIKPYILETMKNNEVITDIIDKNDSRRPKLVPFFQIISKNDNDNLVDSSDIIDSIQNSDHEIIENFLIKNGIIENKYEVNEDF